MTEKDRERELLDSISPDKVKDKLAKWEADERVKQVRFEFVQNGVAGVSQAILNSYETNGTEMTFRFGYDYAYGQITVPVSDDLKIELNTPDRIEMTWKGLRSDQHCVTIWAHQKS